MLVQCRAGAHAHMCTDAASASGQAHLKGGTTSLPWLQGCGGGGHMHPRRYIPAPLHAVKHHSRKPSHAQQQPEPGSPSRSRPPGRLRSEP